MTEARVIKEILEDTWGLPPLVLKVELPGETTRSDDRRPDAFVDVAWGGRARRFVAEIKARSTPKILRDAIARSRALAADTGCSPMVVVPYLRSEQLDDLAREGVSGIDLCGNGVVVVPDELFVYRTGNRNRYRESVPTRYAYRGATSLVPRVFLCRASFASVSEIGDEIRRRGGQVAPSTISKALRRLEEDLAVKREGRSVTLLQADVLLANLAASFVSPAAELSTSLKVTMPWRELLRQTASALRDGAVRIAVSGATSAARWAVGARADAPVVYTDNLAQLVAEWLASGAAAEGARFPDLRVCEISDPLPFFDVRPSDGVPWASPVQTFLELSTGDKREREMAEEVRKQIVREADAAESEEAPTS